MTKRCPTGKRWNGNECVPKKGWSDYGFQEVNEPKLDRLAEQFYDGLYKKTKGMDWRERTEIDREQFEKFTKKHGLTTPMKKQLAGYLDDTYNLHSLEIYMN